MSAIAAEEGTAEELERQKAEQEAERRRIEEQMRARSAEHTTKTPGQSPPDPAARPDLFRWLPAERVHAWTQDAGYHHAIIPHGTPPEELLKPEYWRKAHHILKRYDWLRVTEESGAYRGLLEVVSSDVTGVFVERIFLSPFATQPGTRGGGIKNKLGAVIVDRGPHRRWSVEMPDGSCLRDGFESEALAGQWLAGHIRAQGST